MGGFLKGIKPALQIMFWGGIVWFLCLEWVGLQPPRDFQPLMWTLFEHPASMEGAVVAMIPKGMSKEQVIEKLGKPTNEEPDRFQSVVRELNRLNTKATPMSDSAFSHQRSYLNYDLCGRERRITFVLEDGKVTETRALSTHQEHGIQNYSN